MSEISNWSFDPAVNSRYTCILWRHCQGIQFEPRTTRKISIRVARRNKDQKEKAGRRARSERRRKTVARKLRKKRGRRQEEGEKDQGIGGRRRAEDREEEEGGRLVGTIGYTSD